MFRSAKDTEFAPLPQSESCESVNLTGNDNDGKVPSRKLPTTFVCLLLGVAFFLSAILGALSGILLTQDPDKYCFQRTSRFSPVTQDTQISYHLTRFNGSFMHENIYRKPASPEVDEAWQALGVDYRGAAVPQDLAAKSGLTNKHVQIQEKYGGGYPANVEGLHHLHCLNLLRQSLYFNYAYYQAHGDGAFSNEEPILQLHITHCLDILRQQLMCTIDVGVLGRVWYNKGNPTAFPDFNTVHKCRNFEGVREWAERHQMPEVVPEDFYVRPDLGLVGEEMP
ncbi:hypothetical protein GLAREA_04213 [Glarea lozoyensis ATCC 20868]|uniref:Tat pathway signal sequence n=1 Tax=Glarea lozoyensis (strain ATCC 20868 / MF5171) TaxID=1116229 RepID=S3CLQ5_GLAL2|nr:uncharacterized protein GLAREA_04213 [Glarea lozoyensis ATCC 20868]EPE27422.1 hypothetical protein GLAREA_04213 [Glarea lozoyensis ATCC 20868]